MAADLGATWNRNGDIVLAPHNRVPLHRVPASGGTAQPITALNTARGENSHRWPHFLPDGRHFLFTARSNSKENTAIYIGSLDSTETRLLMAAQSNASFAPPGLLLFGREGTLMAQRFDAGKLSLEGDAFAVAGGLEHVTPSASALFSVSLNGSVLAYQLGNHHPGRLLWFDRAGTNSGAIGLPGEYEYMQPRLSPDGKRVAVVLADPESGNRDVWLMDVASGRLTRFTFHQATDWWPVWSHDGAFIAFASDRIAPSSAYRKASDGSGQEELLLSRSDGGVFPEDVSRDGRLLLFHLNVGSGQTLWTVPLFGERAARALPVSTTSMNARYSPDGKWLAYSSGETGSSEIYVSPAGGGEKVRVSTAGGRFATWGKAGKELFYVAPGEMLTSVEVKAGTTLEPGVPKTLFRLCSASHTLRGVEAFYDVAPDGNRFLVSCMATEARERTVNVVLEWQRLVK
jgi:Tol biopolymer transport system component